MRHLLIKYRLELLIACRSSPALFCLYLYISFDEDSAVQKPEKLYVERLLTTYAIGFGVLVLALLFIRIPSLEALLDKTLFRRRSWDFETVLPWSTSGRALITFNCLAHAIERAGRIGWWDRDF